MRTRAPLLLLTLTSALAIAAHSPGAVIEDAVLIDITPEGFGAVTDLIPALLPERIDVPGLSDDGGIYEYELAGMWVSIGVTQADIIPRNGYLDLNVDLSIRVNESSNPFSLFFEILWVISDTCYGYVNPFDANISAQIGLKVVDTNGDGIGELDATISNLGFSYDIDGADDISLSSCFIGDVEEVLNFFGLSIWDLALDLAGPLLTSAVNDFIPDLEATIEDAFSQAYIQEELDLAGTTVTLEVMPSDVIIEPAGLRLAMSGGLSSPEPAPCIAPYDPGGSLETPSSAPSIGGGPGHHIGVYLSDDFGNQALYSLWRGGLLCYSVTAEEIGFPIDTSILGLLAGDAFDELFPTSKPLIIETRPAQPPTLGFDGDSVVALQLEQLGLEFYAELDYRQALILGMDLSADVGADLSLDAATGNLDVLVDLSSDAVDAVVSDNEFKPDANASIEDNFAGVFDTLVGGVVGGLLGDLGFALPAFEGFGLTSMVLEPAGNDGDWLGLYANIGEVSYGGAGCDSGGGSGCGGGCASGGQVSPRWAALSFALAVAFLRRRRRED